MALCTDNGFADHNIGGMRHKADDTADGKPQSAQQCQNQITGQGQCTYENVQPVTVKSPNSN